MSKKRRGRHEASIDLTPLIDVVFLLLIFFMVSTNFARESQLRINLPEASAQAAEETPARIELLVDKSGEYAVDGRVMVNDRLDTLVLALSEAKRRTAPDAVLIITADALASHQSVVRAMDAAGKAGLINLRITTQQPAENG
jgi:biopolymer transport protein ExbD